MNERQLVGPTDVDVGIFKWLLGERPFGHYIKVAVHGLSPPEHSEIEYALRQVKGISVNSYKIGHAVEGLNLLVKKNEPTYRTLTDLLPRQSENVRDVLKPVYDGLHKIYHRG